MSGNATSPIEPIRNAVRSWAGLLALALLLSGPHSLAGDWPSWRGDQDNRAAAKLSLPAGSKVQSWTFKPARQVWGYEPGMSIWSSPALGSVDGRAVVAVGSYDHNVYLLDAASGQKLWRYTTGGGVYSTPLIWHWEKDIWIFASAADRAVYGLDAKTGARRWSRALTPYLPTTGGSRLSAPSLGRVRGRPALFVGHWVWDKSLAHSTQQGGISALDALDGSLLWTVKLLDNQVSAPIYASIQGQSYVFVASKDGNLHALSADDGKIIWSHTETEAIMGAPLVFSTPAGPRVIIGSHFGKLRCLDAIDGTEIWSFKTGHWITSTATRVTSAGRSLVVFGSYDQRLYALDAHTGEKVWSQVLGGPVHASAAVIERGSDSLIVTAAWDHQLYGVDAGDGSLRWSVYTGAPLWDAIVLGESIWSSPVVAQLDERWMIYHGSVDGVFYGLPLSQAALAGGSPPWGTWRFWLTMLISMAAVAGLALGLTRRARKRKSSLAGHGGSAKVSSDSGGRL